MAELTTAGKAALADIVQEAAGAYPADVDYPLDARERIEARYVQQALAQLGFEVTLSSAAAVWEAYSSAYQAGWLHGATSPDAASVILVYFAEARARAEI